MAESIEQQASLSESPNCIGQQVSVGKPDKYTPSVSVVIPTYNEANNVELVVERVRDALTDYTSEIIIVDDDSPDNTWRIATLLYDDVDSIQVHRRTAEKGLAKAIAYGFKHCSNDYCAVVDADLQHPPEDLPVLLNHVTDDTTIVIGSRYTDFGRIKGWSGKRRIVSFGATKIAKTLFPSIRSVRDPLSGFFIIRRDILDINSISPSGYKILLELLVRCDHEHIEEVPYLFTEREHGESKLTPSEYLAFLKHAFSLQNSR